MMWSMTTRVHAERDVIMIPGSRVFLLDNSSSVVEGQSSLHRLGTKCGVSSFGDSMLNYEDK